MKKEKTHILSLQKNNSGKELEFENEFQLSLSVKQRYRRMKKFIKQTMDYVKLHDYAETPSIISRT